MAAITLMVPDVAVNVPDCPEVVIEKYLRQSAIDFCRRTYAWRSAEAETLSSSELPYDVPAPAGGRVFGVLSVMAGGVALENSGVRDLDIAVSDWRTVTGVPEMFVEESRGLVTVIPLPSTSMDFIITAAYEPTATATTIPDELYRDYQDAIVSGVIMRLSMTARWLNANLVVAHRALYEDGVSRALVSLHGNHTLRGMNTTISPI